MIKSESFIQCLNKNGINYFTGVPDSLLKDFGNFLYEHCPKDKFVIAANEGSAIALAMGHYLSAQEPAMVFMQNSGLGNTVNPLLSLADEKVYGVPMLLIIGWRGKPGEKDEPQHIKQGEVTLSLLEAMGISYSVLPKEEPEALKVLSSSCELIKKENRPHAIIVEKNSFEKYSLKNKQEGFEMTREEAIREIVKASGEKDIFVGTTGKASRELFELRKELGQGHEKDFLTVGGMGHASQIALSISKNVEDSRRVICLDGDGACLMHMGGMPLIGSLSPNNLIHIVLNNSAHESVGGLPTLGDQFSFSKFASLCSYKYSFVVENKEKLREVLSESFSNSQLTFIEVKVGGGSRGDLGRPDRTPKENKIDYMNFLKEG